MGVSFDNAKNEMADIYAQQIGGFYEGLGQEGYSADMRVSILALVDEKADKEIWISYGVRTSHINRDSAYLAFRNAINEV